MNVVAVNLDLGKNIVKCPLMIRQEKNKVTWYRQM